MRAAKQARYKHGNSRASVAGTRKHTHTHTPLGHGCRGKEETARMGDVIEGDLIKWKGKYKESAIVCLAIT